MRPKNPKLNPKTEKKQNQGILGTSVASIRTEEKENPDRASVVHERVTPPASEVTTMARRDALLRLHKTLLARRAALRKALDGELADLGKQGKTGDSADVAFDTGSDEIASQLAELEARELHQIERALVRMKQGTYGMCELCHSKIPVARLDALPYSTTCIECQREMETSTGWDGGHRGTDWEKVYESGKSFEDDREIKLSDIEMDISSSR